MRLVKFLEVSFDILVCIKCLDDSPSGNCLIERAQNIPDYLLSLYSSAPEPFCHLAYHNGRQGKGHKRYEGKFPRHVKKHDQEAYHKQRIPEYDMETACYRVFNLINIIGYA